MSESDVQELIPSREERETLMKDAQPKYTGFTPRPIGNLATKRRPHTMLDIECRHILRCDREQSAHLHKSIEYMLWLEAGKHQPPFPGRPDGQYNSNVWRNFRKTYGFSTSAEKRNVNELIACMYPLNIPKPCKIGNFTFDKYVTESKMFADEKKERLAITRSKSDLEDFKRLRLRSEARYPPMDDDGNILPPVNFKKHVHRFIPPDLTPEIQELPQDIQPDMFGHFHKKSKPLLWKLTYKLNNPEYMKVQDEIRARKTGVQKPSEFIAPKQPKESVA